ncbi:hypothetical protein ACWERV_09070 [Streptomyces sp. NPDC004031]
MSEGIPFGTRLALLLDHRGLPAAELASRTGEAPAADLLRRLAPALGLHTVDLFVLADLDVPPDLEPRHPDAEGEVGSVVTHAVRLPPTEQRRLLAHMRALPDEEASGAPFGRPTDDGYRHTPGGRIVRMLRHRNLSRSGIAHVLGACTPTYLSAATYHAIRTERTELTPRLVTDFGTVLGIDAHELALLTGGPHPGPSSTGPVEGEEAALLWAARRLSAAQLAPLHVMVRAQRQGGGGR